jgi:methylase of polypeptide subunit release factors
MNRHLLVENINVVLHAQNEQLNGGGNEIYQEMIELLSTWYPDHQFDRCFEWCAGPGTMGFAILGAGIAKTLCLADVYEPSITAHRETILQCGLSNRVSSYYSDNLKDIPESEQWDLVVANPPHFPNAIQLWPNTATRLYVDTDWQLHKEFFANIKKHLKPNGKIMLWEAVWGSSVETFRPWIEQAGLKVSRYGNASTIEHGEYWYWIEIE